MKSRSNITVDLKSYLKPPLFGVGRVLLMGGRKTK